MPVTTHSTHITKDSPYSENPSQVDNENSWNISENYGGAWNRKFKGFIEAKYAKKILQLSEINYTKNIFHEIESVPSGADRVIEKRAIIKALLLSTWLQRLYFIIRASLMSVLAMVVTFFMCRSLAR